MRNPKKLIKKCRYPGDKNLQKDLLNDSRIKSFLKDNKQSFQTASDHNYQINLSHSLQVTPNSSPYLFEIVDKCLSVIDLKTSEINVFIISNQEINAWCSKTEDRVNIGINSGLINAMEFDEVCFIVGHEFGHAFYDHHSLPAYGISQGARLPPSKLMRLMSWSRQSEISADRAGMLCCGSLDASVQALIKLSTGGLGAPVISFDVDEFENQLSDIDSFIDDNSDLMYTTHPLNPFRVRALIEFSKLPEISGKDSKENLSMDEIDSKIDELIENEVQVTLPMLERVRDNYQRSGELEDVMVGMIDRTACAYQLFLDKENNDAERRWTSPFGLILEHTVRLGQHDLTEKEVHDIWIKKRFNAFAEVIGVELEISDIGEDGMVSIKAVKPISMARQ